jgi:hypothetical protein
MWTGAAACLIFCCLADAPTTRVSCSRRFRRAIPDREKALRVLRVFVAAVYDDQRYVRACIEHAFETWRSQTGQ